jgi:hypothetical protein
MTKELSFSTKTSNLYIIVGSVSLGCALIIAALGVPNYFLLGSSPLFIFIGLWYKNNKMITIEEDHFVMKAAPAAPKRMILFTEIKSLDGDLIKRASIMINENGAEKKINIPINFLTPEDRELLIKELQNKIPNKIHNS